MKFTGEELVVLDEMLREHLGDCLPSERRVLLMGILVQVHQDLLLGAAVSFERDGEEVVGTLGGFEDWEGIPLVHVSFEGMHRRVHLKDVPALSKLANEMDEYQKLKEALQ